VFQNARADRNTEHPRGAGRRPATQASISARPGAVRRVQNDGPPAVTPRTASAEHPHIVGSPPPVPKDRKRRLHNVPPLDPAIRARSIASRRSLIGMV
jgi:hypothetical protein